MNEITALEEVGARFNRAQGWLVLKDQLTRWTDWSSNSRYNWEEIAELQITNYELRMTNDELKTG
jgi:hypothetical protein